MKLTTYCAHHTHTHCSASHDMSSYLDICEVFTYDSGIQ